MLTQKIWLKSQNEIRGGARGCPLQHLACCCGSRCLRFCRGRCVAELEKAEYCCPNDARRCNEGEAVDEVNKAEVHHVQRDPDYGHRCGIFHKVVLVVVPGLYPQVTPIFARRCHFLGSAHGGQQRGALPGDESVGENAPDELGAKKTLGLHTPPTTTST